MILAAYGSPHVRGDGPLSHLTLDRFKTFSPRAWGWSAMSIYHAMSGAVLPTCVGMVRYARRHHRQSRGSPHVRGDGPPRASTSIEPRVFSPRAWGWSETASARRVRRDVLPTCVGMVRAFTRRSTRSSRSPHVRGDGPPPLDDERGPFLFSPRAWGWSAPIEAGGCSSLVLPTCVGMVRWTSRRVICRRRSPHVRGDGPMGFCVASN